MDDKSGMSEKLYQRLFAGDDKAAKVELSDNAQREVPRNFLLTLLSQFLTQLGDALVNAKVILPWVMNSIGAPVYLSSFLVPIRESGSLIPQLIIAGFIKRFAIRKWVWVWGSVLCAVSVGGIGLVTASLEGTLAGWLVIALLIIFSLARGLTSVSSKDVTGKTIPKNRRGRLSGWSASAAGLITLAVGGLFMLKGKDDLSALLFGILIGAAALTWLIGAYSFSHIVEDEGETATGDDGSIWSRLSLLKTDAAFRHFVTTRALMLATALVAPFYVLLAQQELGSPGYLLGLFLLASGGASLLSGPFWGKLADLSSRQVMILSAGFAGILGLIVFAISILKPDWLNLSWLLPLVYFALNVAHQGVRVGRKTYLVNMASGNKRTDYVSVSNTVIGVLLLITGLIGSLASLWGINIVILLLSIMALAGALMALSLDEVE